MGREQFIEWAWKWKLEKGNIIFEQLEKLGASLDWKRNSFTLSDSHATAVNKAFETLYKKGLIYRGNFLVNWSCKLGSAISDIEVNYITVEKETRIVVPGYDKSIEFGIMYNFAYTLADGSGKLQSLKYMSICASGGLKNTTYSINLISYTVLIKQFMLSVIHLQVKL